MRTWFSTRKFCRRRRRQLPSCHHLYCGRMLHYSNGTRSGYRLLAHKNAPVPCGHYDPNCGHFLGGLL